MTFIHTSAVFSIHCLYNAYAYFLTILLFLLFSHFLFVAHKIIYAMAAYPAITYWHPRNKTTAVPMARRRALLRYPICHSGHRSISNLRKYRIRCLKDDGVASRQYLRGCRANFAMAN